ncbi:tRNA (N(6)-L-threonylcarbamoyladenosine(37)-C(2))-methylthiotransferase MtaB [Chloroflexota bacterium]
MKAASIAVDTIGCKLNQAESDALARDLITAGFRVIPSEQEADVYVLNTCTVTHIADRKARHLLRMAHRRNPDTFIIAIGCYAKRASSDLKSIEGVGLVIEDKQNQNLIELIVEAGYKPNLEGETDYTFRTRAMLKIQHGCNRKCAYCIVPQTRGQELSIPAAQVIEEANRLIEDGFKEIVLTGTHIGSHDDLAGLIEQILTETRIERLRLSSLQPTDITPSLLNLWQDERLCRHIHLPLQSGCDSILDRMGRWYSTSEFKNAVTVAREAIPEISITTDVIVGFPDETEAEFAQSYNFCRLIEFANLHVFTYSPRPNTIASTMKDLRPQIKKVRSNKMLDLAKELSQKFNSRYIGQTMLVLWEGENGKYTEGLTDNYIRVFTASKENLTNRILPAKLASHHKTGLMGGLSHSQQNSSR